jgi:hypothetical protein
MQQVRRHRRSKRDGERQGKPAAERKRKKKIELSTTENEDEDEPERIGSRQGLPSRRRRDGDCGRRNGKEEDGLNEQGRYKVRTDRSIHPVLS